MIRRPPRSTLDRSSAASDVYKRQRRRATGRLPTGAEPSNHGGVDAALQAYLQECCCEGRRRCGRSPNAIGTTLAIERTEELNFDTLIPKTNAIAEGFVAPGDEPTADLLTGSLSPRKSSGNREWRRRSSASSEESNARTCLLYTSPSPRDRTRSRMPSSA